MAKTRNKIYREVHKEDRHEDIEYSLQLNNLQKKFDELNETFKKEKKDHEKDKETAKTEKSILLKRITALKVENNTHEKKSQEQLQAAEKALETLKDENSTLKNEIDQLKKQLTVRAKSADRRDSFAATFGLPADNGESTQPTTVAKTVTAENEAKAQSPVKTPASIVNYSIVNPWRWMGYRPEPNTRISLEELQKLEKHADDAIQSSESQPASKTPTLAASSSH